jgi:hypothetical protein
MRQRMRNHRPPIWRLFSGGFLGGLLSKDHPGFLRSFANPVQRSDGADTGEEHYETQGNEEVIGVHGFQHRMAVLLKGWRNSLVSKPWETSRLRQRIGESLSHPMVFQTSQLRESLRLVILRIREGALPETIRGSLHHLERWTI